MDSAPQLAESLLVEISIEGVRPAFSPVFDLWQLFLAVNGIDELEDLGADLPVPRLERLPSFSSATASIISYF
jgi:hypothetical protein